MDLENVLDRITRRVLWWGLRSVGVEELTVPHSQESVTCQWLYSEEFSIEVGVHQGSLLMSALHRYVGSSVTGV